jgi:radical SAM superfamily enzyme YgiQ (UPF0313 family)
MINKILLFGDFSSKDFDDFWSRTYLYYKNSSLLRLGNALYKEGFSVKQVHHCTSFTRDELDHIFKTFGSNEKVLVCISSSFLSSVNRMDYRFHADEDKGSIDVRTLGGFWGNKAFEFIKNIAILCKKYNYPALVGGFDIRHYKFITKEDWFSWGIDVFNTFVSYFVMGYSHTVISDFCRGKNINHTNIACKNGKTVKVVYTESVKDWEDYAFTPTPDTYIAEGESLISQLSGGCIFSCSFCTYEGLGKKPDDYMRTYDSLKNEIVHNWNNYKTRTYMFVDNMINDNWKKMEYLVRIREETGIDVRWGAYARLDTITNKSRAQLFKDSGASGIIFGIESMKKDVGQYIGKMTDGEKIKDMLHMFRDSVGDSCLVSGSFIAGAPTESKEELKSTYEWLNSQEGNHLLDHYIFTPLFIEPGINIRTEINKKRNDPFRDYQLSSIPKIRNRGTGWTSPWGTYDEFLDLAIEYSNLNNKSLSLEEASVARRGIFAMPIISNLLENGINDYVRLSRNREPFHMKNKKIFREKTTELIEEYKKMTLNFNS